MLLSILGSDKRSELGVSIFPIYFHIFSMNNGEPRSYLVSQPSNRFTSKKSDSDLIHQGDGMRQKD